jgi:branched-chain amino acid transport system ATP-binding protein
MTDTAMPTEVAAPAPQPGSHEKRRALLELDDVHAYYGAIHALQGISLFVNEGEIVTLIGANGAGKTTTLNAISGLVRARDGSIRLDGQEIGATPPHEVVTKGIVQVPEGRRVFSRLTVDENLKMGAYTVKDQAEVRAGIERAYEMFPRLKERRAQVAGTLSGGEQQMLAMGRGLMASPKVLLLDEPSMGLAPTLVELIFDTIERINKDGMTILLVEQNALMALSVANRGYILQTGTIVLTDTPDRLRDNEEVKRAYLGG